jgi:hypothetical protein
MMGEIKKRIKRIVGNIDVDRDFHQLDQQHIVVKPNSFSQSGILLDGRVLSPISYGEIGVVPISMTYGLSQEQIQTVLRNCEHPLQQVSRLIQDKSYFVANEVGKDILEEVCLCLNSVRKGHDKTLNEVEKRLSLPNRHLYVRILKVLNQVPKLNAKHRLAQCIDPLQAYRGLVAHEMLKSNHSELLKNARETCVPFLTPSTFEQDHFGLGKMPETDLLISKEDYNIKMANVAYSPLHFNGVGTITERTGAQIVPTEPKDIDPLKKKQLFQKAIKTMDYLRDNEDDMVLQAFGRMVSILNLEGDTIDYDRLIVSKYQEETPFIIPMIVNDQESEYLEFEYKPIQALQLINQNMKPHDFVGSSNDETQPFPFGADQPLASPRRVKSEVR